MLRLQSNESCRRTYELNACNQPGGLGHDDGTGVKKKIWVLFLPAILRGSWHSRS
jgi:hypothetical protein